MVERLGDGDLAALMALYGHLHAGDELLDERVAAARWQEVLAMPGHTVFGVRRDGQLVASCVLQVVPNLTRGGRPYALMENVVVHADHRRRGIGTAMVADVLDRAWEAGCYKVMLLTHVTNVAGQAFYEAVGFDGDAKRGFLARPPTADAVVSRPG